MRVVLTDLTVLDRARRHKAYANIILDEVTKAPGRSPDELRILCEAAWRVAVDLFPFYEADTRE